MPRFTVLCLLLTMLAACSTLERRAPPSASWAEHAAAVAAVDEWTARGKMALRSTAAQESASIQWQQRGTRAHVRLSGPMGVGATEIFSDGTELDIRQGSERRILDISSPRAIMLNTGWDLPLAALPYWIRGLPEPDTDIQRRSIEPDTGLLRTLRQRDWEIRYLTYDRFDTLMLPTRLTVENGDTRATLLIRHWDSGAD